VQSIVNLAGGGGGGTIGGTIANTQVAFGTGVDTISGDAAFTYNSTDDVLTTEGHVLTPQTANPEITNPLTNLWINSENGHLYRGNRDTESTVHFNVRNDEGVTIPLGAPLYSRGEILGANRVLVGIADATNSAKMPAIGIAMEEMNTTSTKDGNAMATGILNEDINSFSGLTNNTVLYVAPHGGTWSTVAGLITPTRPTGPTHLVQNVGICIRQSGAGTIMKGFNVAAIGRINDTPNTILTTGNITSLLNIEGASIIKTGGTSNQFLKADGSVDSNTYLANVVEDTTPQLGGTLDANAKSITNAGTVQADQFQAITNSIISVAGAATFNAQNGVYVELTLNENCSLTITNLGAGTPAVLKVTQDGVSSFNITSYVVAGGTVKWPGGAIPAITTAANSIDIITFISDGIDIYASIVQDFK
jgi:hypothetical protein